MRFSHSRVECFEKCRYQFKLRYIRKLTTIFPPAADNALVVGSAMHLGLEKGLVAMQEYYFSQYPIISDLHLNEMIKLTTMVEKAGEVLQELGRGRASIFEHEIVFPDFIGYVDLIIHNGDGSADVYDFKYSNNIDHYLESKQLHLYKYYLEKQGFDVFKLGYVFIPKTQIRQKKTEDLYQFRKRLTETLAVMQVKVVEVPYDSSKVEEFFQSCREIQNESIYERTPSRLCAWCEFQKYCEEDIDFMLLPKNEKRERTMDLNPDKWIYGDSYVGKSTFIDRYDDMLAINTDGNIDNLTSPVVRITDEVTYEGRLRTEKLAWEVFLAVIDELEKKDNTFKRVAIDLVEDLYEHCRLYIYKKLGIDHEQDAGYGKGWDMVRTEFLSAMKRLKNLGYQVIFISKELTSEITLKNGNKITTIKPNLNDKVANVLAGIVDLTVRAFMDGDERYLLLEKKENVFGGGRFNFKVPVVKLDKDEFIKALEAAQEGIKTYSRVGSAKEETAGSETNEEETAAATAEDTTAATEEPEKPAKRSRRSRKSSN
jgi:CRISPR/Cas system-associated exonuclease Cas4 (RecB family)